MSAYNKDSYNPMRLPAMSITALILTQSIGRQDELAAKYGRRNAARALFVTAARLIAGDYSN